MNDVVSRVLSFEDRVFKQNSALYAHLAKNGQEPKALIISCADSRVVPEQIVRAEPGELFVCRNAGNIVPPYSQANGGVSSTVEYGVMVLGVTDLIVCGHSDCGAMKAASNPAATQNMPNVTAWLRHSSAAAQVVRESYPALPENERVRAISLENVVAQLNHLRTHPSVAAGIARGDLALHGWFVDIHVGQVLALDGRSGRFVPVHPDRPLPVAHAPARRLAADFAPLEAAE